MENAEQAKPTITVDDETYEIDSLPDNVKELLGLHQEAQDRMLKARREAAIAEVAVNGFVQMISASVKEQAQTEDADTE